MADSEIRVAVTASTGAATAALEDFGDRGAKALQEYNLAASKGAKSATALGAAFDVAIRSGADFTTAMEKAVVATTAQASATTKSTGALQGNSMAARQATDAMYVLNGSTFGAARAVGELARKMPALGAAISAAFDAFIVLAFIEMAVRAGEAIATALDLSGKAAAQFQKNLASANDGFNVLIARTELQTDKLEAMNAKLEHRAVPNAPKEALDAALLSAARLDSALDTVLAKEQTLLQSQSLNPGFLAQVLTGSGTNRAEQVMLEQHRIHMEEAGSLEDQLKESESFKGVLDQSLAKVNQGLANAREIALHPVAGGVGLGTANVAGLDRQKQSLELLVAAQAKEQAAIRGTMALQKAQGINAVDEANKQLELLNKTTAARAEHVKTLNTRADGKIFGSTSALRAQEATKAAKELATEHARDLVVMGNMASTAEKLAALERKQAQDATVLANQQVARDAQERGRTRIAGIDASERTGGLTPVQADRARAASDARMYTEQIAALRDALAALAPTTRAAAEAQRQLNQVIAQSQASSLKNNAKTATDIAKPYVDATNQINSAWLGMQNKLIFGTRNVGRAFANMGVQMLESVAGNFEKMLVKQLQYEVQSRIAHSVSNQLKVTSDAVAAGESSAITSANALKELFVHAKVDAAKAYGAYSGIPVIGPALGAGAAAATFAAIMAMGAFERGGIVPNTGIALVHGGEGVLPRNLTTMLTSVANSNSSMSSSSAVHSTANFNGITDRNFKDMARRHADTVADSVHRAVRNGRRF